MRSGRINKIISIQAPASEIDARTGQKVPTWSELAVIWAGIEPLRGNDLYAAQQHNSEITTKIVIRWTQALEDSINHTFTVVFRRTRYQLLSDPINPNSSNRELHLMCKVVS